jgi:hypothetical protein
MELPVRCKFLFWLALGSTVMERDFVLTGLDGSAEGREYQSGTRLSVSLAPQWRACYANEKKRTHQTPEPMIWVCRDNGTLQSARGGCIAGNGICTHLPSLILSI